jgi:tRNA threonylcarbamoyladenosine modification (KEOPS) complex Cgi121 subunit
VIFEVPDLRLYVWISAFNTTPHSLDELFRDAAEKFPDTSIQLVDLDKVPGQRYLKLAAVNATKSFQSKQPIAKTLAMELLLYISAEKQIVRALKRVGVTAETQRVAALAVGGSRDQVLAATTFLTQTLGQNGEDRLLDDWTRQRVKNVRLSFEIGAKELRAIIGKDETESMAVERLAVERSALLAAKR